jgi:hypothetical protein
MKIIVHFPIREVNLWTRTVAIDVDRVTTTTATKETDNIHSHPIIYRSANLTLFSFYYESRK